MIEDQTARQEITQSILASMQQILPSIDKEGPRWQKIVEAFHLAFHQIKTEVRNLQTMVSYA